jgi:hypothetical protein
MSFTRLFQIAASPAAVTLLLTVISMPTAAQSGPEVQFSCTFSAAQAAVAASGAVNSNGSPMDTCGISVGLQQHSKGKWLAYGTQVGAGLEPDGTFAALVPVCGEPPYPKALRAQVVLQCDGASAITAHCTDDRSTPGNQSRVRLPRDIQQLCDDMSNF